MIKARFKTAAEFEMVHGPRWRHSINFSVGMDKFLGQFVPDSFDSELQRMYSCGESFSILGYTITYKMLIFNNNSNWIDRLTPNPPTKEKSDKIDISCFQTKFVTV